MHAASFWIGAWQYYGLLILDHPLLVTATSSDHAIIELTLLELII